MDFTKTRMLTEDAGKTFTVCFAGEAWHWDTLVDPDVHRLVQRILSGEFKTQNEAADALGVVKSSVTKMLGKAYTAGITTPQEIAAALRAAREAPEDDDDRGAANDDF